jgi:membrane-bound lytic murein transglycosylase C
VIAAYNTGARNVTRTFAAEKRQALDNINALEPPALFEQLRTKLPFEETRQYVMRVSVYRRQFEGPALTPAAAGMQ